MSYNNYNKRKKTHFLRTAFCYNILFCWMTVLKSHLGYKVLGWPKSLFGFFCKIWKKPNELFGQPNKKKPLGSPGGAVVETLPVNAGDMGSSPGLGRSHMPRSD